MKNPLISIITSTYNSSATLERCIRSVRNQDYSNIEFIVVDGGSVDGTVEIIKKHSDVISAWISEPDSGIYEAWNKGILLSKGDWICFLGSDDELITNVIFLIIKELKDHKCKVDYISGKTDLYLNNEHINTTGKPFKWNEFRWHVSTGHNGALHNRSLYQEYGLYDIYYKSSGDYEFLLRIGKNLSTLYVDVVTTKMHLGGVSNSSIVPIVETFKAKIKHKTNFLPFELSFFVKSLLLYYYRTVLRKILWRKGN